MINLTVKIGGEAGFGIMTTGLFLGKLATRSGYHAFEYPEYPSLIRGGHNVVSVRISDENVFAQEKDTDVLVCLNLETYELHINELKKGGLIILDQEKVDISKSSVPNPKNPILAVPFSKIISDNKLEIVMINNIALGVLEAVLGIDKSILEGLITETFLRKSQEIIDKNLTAARLGYEAARTGLPDGYSVKIPKKESPPKMYLTGNEAVGFGAIAADCRMYVAYPMTPSSALLHYLAAKAEKCGMVVKHAEDEISVINMALGSSWAGVRSMVGTSGGGFALMVEAVSLAGITETPIVIMMGQRPGPATGMPTWTEQGDLLFILHSGHGEFPKIVLAPGDMKEAYEMTIEAFNLADIYQTPVFIMTDKYLLEGHASVDKAQIVNYQFQINRGKLLSQKELDAIKSYKRYEVTDDGISPRAITGMKGSLHQANSYEHLENGHTTEDANERIRQVDKRNRKFQTYLKNDARLPTVYGPKNADITLVAWGSTKGPALQAMKECKKKINLLHFTHVWPLPSKETKEILQSQKRLLLVENNSTAQFGQLLHMVTGVSISDTLLKYSGRPVDPEEIIEKVQTMI